MPTVITRSVDGSPGATITAAVFPGATIPAPVRPGGRRPGALPPAASQTGGLRPMSVERTDDVEVFYHATYQRLVGLLTLAGGSRSDAEEIAQETYIRLIPRWSTVSRYDLPEAWLRKVAFRLLAQRNRRSHNRVTAMHRAASSTASPAPSAEGVDVMRALAQLPDGQRHAVVLHHLLDLPVEQVADELGVAPGTVKSRLARARAALAPLLDLEVSDDA